jgi:hypothetical protein
MYKYTSELRADELGIDVKKVTVQTFSNCQYIKTGPKSPAAAVITFTPWPAMCHIDLFYTFKTRTRVF